MARKLPLDIKYLCESRKPSESAPVADKHLHPS